MDAELPDGVIHEDHHVFHRDADVPVGPTALVRPVLGAFTLRKERKGQCCEYTLTETPLL